MAGDPWGIGDLRGEEKPNIKQIVKETVKKSQKSAKSEKKSEKSEFFLLKMVSNALGTPRNSNKMSKTGQKKHKIGKIGLGYVRIG